MKTVIITGGAIRVGKGLALKFLEKFWNLVIIYNSSESQAQLMKNELADSKSKVSFFKCDLTDISACAEIFTNIYKEYKFIDVLINNAGVFPDRKLFSELEYDDMQQALNVNMKISFNTIKEYTKHQTGGRIVNIGSVGSLEIWDRRIDYNVSETAMLQLSKALALDLAPNYSVNTVNPGLVSFEQTKEKEKLQLNETKIPMKRYANIQDIFDGVYFFANASKYITGQFLNIDGGKYL